MFFLYTMVVRFIKRGIYIKMNIKRITLAILVFLTVYYMDNVSSVKAEESTFQDLVTFEEEINYLHKMGIINGFSDTEFRPSESIKRVDAVRMIIRELDADLTEIKDPNFKDVPKDFSGYKEIAKAKELEIVDGIGDGKFAPYATLTRAQMAKILVNAYELKGDYEESFTDVKDEYWASTYISTLAANRITIGYPDNTFRPTKEITRQNFSAFLARKLDKNFIPHTFGTSMADMLNGGNFAQGKEWTYFGDVGISKISINEEEVHHLTSTDNDGVYSLNLVDNVLYYINVYDNFAIYKVNTDGTGREKLVDSDVRFLQVKDNWMYYTNFGDDSLYKAKLDGTSQTKLADTSEPYTLGIYEDYIYFADNKREGFFRIKTDGTNREKLTSEEITYFDVYKELLYYVSETDDGFVNHMTLEGEKRGRVLNESINSFNITDDRFYFTTRKDGRLFVYDFVKTQQEALPNAGFVTSVMTHGGWLYFAEYNQDGTYQWYKMKENGDYRHQIPISLEFE